MMDLDALVEQPMMLSSDDDYEILVVSPLSGFQDSLLSKFFALRSAIFVTALGWAGVSEAKGFEVDEYDLSTTYYILMLEKKSRCIVAGLRVCPTHHEQVVSPISDHPTSYMIRDAYLGRLEGIPSTICSEAPPAKPTAVELSRLISRNPRCLRPLIVTSSLFLSNAGISLCLLLASPAFLRLGRQWGFRPYTLGPVQETPDGKYQAIAYDPSYNTEETNEF